MPITQANSDIIKGIPDGENLINQTAAAVDSKGNVHVAYYANDINGIPQYQHLWFNGATWENMIISERIEKFDLIGGGVSQTPISCPEILIDKQDNVYIVYRADFTKEYMVAHKIKYPWTKKGKIKILWEHNLAYSEPVVDRMRWKNEGVLSMLIQKNYQQNHDIHDEATARPPEPC